jgi:hypothetical protein
MTALVWDKTGEKFYQTGIQCGVLYLHDGRVAVWNGLTGMDETSESELSSYYLDGVKYLENLSPGDFSGQLKAWTYPDEFDSVTGIAEVSPGLEYYEQPPKSFNLSYQTRISNDIDSELGYKIHLLYNLLAKPDSFAFETLSEKAEAPTEFSWSLTGTPPLLTGFRPTVHVVVDSIKTPPQTLQAIEDMIYGTATTDPRFPTIDELRGLFEVYGILVIIDNGDGTWTAIDEADDYITMNSSTQFTINNADATYLDATTYRVSTTYP